MFEIRYIQTDSTPVTETVNVETLLTLLSKHKNKDIMIVSVTLGTVQLNFNTLINNLKL